MQLRQDVGAGQLRSIRELELLNAVVIRRIELPRHRDGAPRAGLISPGTTRATIPHPLPLACT